MEIAFQGERGAYGEEAVVRYFGDEVQPLPCRSFADVFQRVAAGQVAAGVVPVENSQAGSINETYDLLLRHDLFIRGELTLLINHCLMALPGTKPADLVRVCSHPQALAQCDQYLAELGVEIVATYDTAGSAKMVREQQLTGVAAVAGARAAELYGLQVLAEGIQTIKDNYTRFLVLGQEPIARQEGPQRTALVMATDHRPGALYHSLGCLAKRNINLLKLESRPSRARPWEWVFYLDFEGHREDPVVREALAELGGLTVFLKVLGSFTRHDSL